MRLAARRALRQLGGAHAALLEFFGQPLDWVDSWARHGILAVTIDNLKVGRRYRPPDASVVRAGAANESAMAAQFVPAAEIH
jgi:hypothetical protein